MAASTRKSQRSHVSRNKKKSWKKYCDINDVEEYLEEKRFEERIGGPVHQKADHELFFVDSEIKKSVRKKKKDQPLRCFQNLGAYTKVPVPVKTHPTGFTKRITKKLVTDEEKRARKLLKRGRLDEKEKHDSFARDIWAEEKKDPEIADLITYCDEITCKRVPKIPVERYNKRSLLPAIEVPHAGASYNPDKVHHRELVVEAIKIEEEKLKRNTQLERALKGMYPSRKEAPTEESLFEELTQGLFDEEEEEDSEEVDHSAYISCNPPITSEGRITRAKKRKRKELKLKARQRALAKLLRKRANDIYRLKSIKTELKNEEKSIEERKAKKVQLRKEQMYKPRNLSKYKYEPQDLEVNLTNEIKGSLRKLKVEGNLLEDRFKSLQRRNIIEARIRQKKQKNKKLKVQIKRSHKD